MEKIRIDVAGYVERTQSSPQDAETGIWTFKIDGRTIGFFGRYAEAKSLAKLYVRSHDVLTNDIELIRRSPVGRVHTLH